MTKKAKNEKKVKLNYDIKPLGKNEYEAVVTANIENGWHIYSKDINPETGAIPTEFKIKSKKIRQKYSDGCICLNEKLQWFEFKTLFF